MLNNLIVPLCSTQNYKKSPNSHRIFLVFHLFLYIINIKKWPVEDIILRYFVILSPKNDNDDRSGVRTES